MLPAFACRDTVSGFGAGVRARASTDQLFGALTDRFVDILRNPKYEHARTQLTRGALTPARVFDDTASWTARSGDVRLLETFGTPSGGRYLMSSRTGVPAPTRLGEGRHALTLSRLSDDEFRWDTSVDFAIGSVQPTDIALVISRLIAAGEGRTEAAARAEIASTAPRTAAALSSLFSLDTLRPVPLADGSTSVTIGIGVNADQLGRRLPALAAFVHRYVDPARYRFLLQDRAGVPFMELSQKDRRMTIRVRTQGGHMVPLSGPARAMPDTLVLMADFTVKVKLFTVGFHDLSLDFVNGARGDGMREWVMVGRREPGWNLPFITARLLRAPLRRPFAGEGALFRIGVRAGEGGGPTLLYRQARLSVQESAILRFLNSLTSKAMDDFAGTVEHEENQWLRELFAALRDDARAGLPGR